MSDVEAIGLITGVILVGVFLYLYVDKWLEERVDTIVTGVVRGVVVSIEHRRMLLQTRLKFLVIIQIFLQALVSLGLWLLAGAVSNEGAALYAYLGSFFFFSAVLGWSVLFPSWYRYLARVLRQAESR